MICKGVHSLTAASPLGGRAQQTHLEGYNFVVEMKRGNVSLSWRECGRRGIIYADGP